ncbi:hypothetical protein D3C77_136580 [compost metagenome]
MGGAAAEIHCGGVAAVAHLAVGYPAVAAVFKRRQGGAHRVREQLAAAGVGAGPDDEGLRVAGQGLAGVIELEVIYLGAHRTGVEGADPDVVDLVGVGRIPRRARQGQHQILGNGRLAALTRGIEAVDQGAVTAPRVALHLDQGLTGDARVYGQSITVRAIAVRAAVHGRGEAVSAGILGAVVAGALEVVVAAGAGARATHHHGLLASPLVGRPAFTREVAVLIYAHPEPATGKAVDPWLETIPEGPAEGARLGGHPGIGEHHRHAVRPVATVGILVELYGHQVVGGGEEPLVSSRGGLLGAGLGHAEPAIDDGGGKVAAAASHHPVVAEGAGREVVAEAGQILFTDTGPVAGKGLVDDLAVVRHGDIHRRHGTRQLGLSAHGQIARIHIENGVEFGIVTHDDLAKVVEPQVIGLAPGIDLHLVAQGQVTLEVELGRKAGIEDQLVVAAKLQLVDPVAATTEVEPDVGRALMLEGLDVICLQVAIDDAVVAHLQGLMQFEGQIAATARRRDLALSLHI